MIASAPPLRAAYFNLNNETIYVRRGFDIEWLTREPDRNDRNWLSVQGSKNGDRKVVLKELPFEGMPRRPMFSLKKYGPENFTFVTAFSASEKDLAYGNLWGIFFANIAENWAVYLNDRLLKSEIYVDDRGDIIRYRHLREVLIPVDPRLLKPGRNILAIRIIADPTNIDSGFHRSNPFIIDRLDLLEKARSEQLDLILIFLYLFSGLYHLFFFMKRTDERYNLFYGAFSVMLFVYLLSRTHAIYAVIPDSTVLHRIEYCSLYLLIPLFGAFADLFFLGAMGRLTKTYAAFCGLLAAVTLLPVSNPFAIDILRVWQVSVIVPLLYYLFIRIGKPAKKYFLGTAHEYRNHLLPLRIFKALGKTLTASNAGNMLLGAFIVVACALFDIADSLFWAYDYVVTQYGFFIFTMGITLVLANRFISMHRQLEMTNEATLKEFDLAAQIQRLILPPIPEEMLDWDIALLFRPKYGPSGDFYDFYYSGGTLQGISIFDVSGHGVSSALITMIVKPITFRFFSTMRGESLEKVISSLNERVSSEMTRLDNYISSIIVRFEGNRAEYVNAGHPDLLHRAGGSGAVRIIGDDAENFRGEPLGMNIAHRKSSVVRFTVEKGDLLLLFTDCILESKNARHGRFGLERLTDLFHDAPDGSAREVLDFIIKKFDSFADEEDIRDDLTVIVAKKIS